MIRVQEGQYGQALQSAPDAVSYLLPASMARDVYLAVQRRMDSYPHAKTKDLTCAM